jgi:hypothetical protein
MTAIGKLLAVVNLVAGLGLLTWSVNLYVQRPGWFADPPDTVDKGSSPVGFKQLKVEADALYRGAAVASEEWGTHLKALEEREKVRAERRDEYVKRLRWAHTGNPKDLIDKDNPKSGKGFYEPVIDPATKLFDLKPDPATGLPKGAAVLGVNGTPLPGLDGLLDSITGDKLAALELNKQTILQKDEYDRLKKLVLDTQERAIKMGIIRDSVQAELFFLSTFEVNVFETRETVFRRERQLRGRLKVLGLGEP